MRKIKLLMFGVVLAALLALPGAAMAKSRDRNHDRIPDKWEKHYKLSTHRNVANGDPDKDGLKNLGEFRSHTNPRKADTNGDGVRDGQADTDNDGVSNSDEMSDQTNPSDSDTDNDGVNDGQEKSGTIESFTPDQGSTNSGTLVIKLADNSTVSGRVDSTTEIECHNQGDDTPGAASRHGADDNSGSSTSGSSSDDGPNHDVNDDHGDHQGGDDQGNCTTADLTPGTAVHEADLHGTGADAVFEKVELLKAPATTP